MLEMMKAMGEQASQQTQTQLDIAAKSLRMMYDSYVNAGFGHKIALELTKEVLRSCILGGFKK